jgi:hypothetical protein
MPPSSLSELRRTSKKKAIISTLQYMLRANDQSIWWRAFPDTPMPDTINDTETRDTFYSSSKFEEHREASHSAVNTCDNYSSEDEEESRDGPSDWQDHDGNGCSSCDDFRDVWTVEEWIFAVAFLLFDGVEEITAALVNEKIHEHRSEITLEAWVEEKLDEEKEQT